MAYTFNEDVFVVDCWTDTKEKENILKQLLLKLKVYGCPIVLCGHYPVNPEIAKLSDYFLFIQDNDLLLEKDYEEYGVNSDRWTDMGGIKIINKTKFHHDYAIWVTMKHAFKFCESLGKKYIHFLEYDNLPDEVQYRQAFMEYVRSNDAVVYEYDKGSTKQDNPYSATYVFSIKTDIANQVVSKINTKEEFFKNKTDKWQLEKNFYQRLREVTGSIFVSKYIPNNNEFNLIAAWNRNGILRNNARLQTYLGVDNKNLLYIHFISGFSEKKANKDYLIEIVYNNTSRFMTIEKDKYYLEPIGWYQKNAEVSVFYQGVEIFNEVLNEDIEEFRRKNKIIKKDVDTNRKINIHNIDGPFVEITENGDYMYELDFIDTKNNKSQYKTILKSNHWAKCSIEYYVDWKIIIRGLDNDFYKEINTDFTGQKILVSFESKSLGDTLAFIPYVEKFRTDKNVKVVCSTFHNYLFKEQYPNIEFVEPGTNVNNIVALYRLGLFYKTIDGKRQVDFNKHPSEPKKEPLMKVASDILGLRYIEQKTKLKKLGKKKYKRVCIATHSTSQCKYWNNPNGWQDVVDFLIGKGYEVRLLSKEEDGYMGNKNPEGVVKQPASTIEEIVKVLQESELFIGISSGLSWLSWASGIPTMIISGFTDVDLEPIDGVTRIINKNVCNSCWSNYDFDPGNWFWCPVHQNTENQFECSKSITSEDVIDKIKEILQ